MQGRALSPLRRNSQACRRAFDLNRLAAAEATLQAARAQLEKTDTAYLQATKEEASLQAQLVSARARSAEAVQSRAAVMRIEGELGWWNLLGKALGNDGVIALCVDDAGPELARLTNELLLACYGPRFTVSIRTQVETVRKELREGFDVVVFDADTGQAKSVGVMSGGERIWISCRSRHEIHYAENPDMPSGVQGDGHDPSLCEAKSGSAARHKTPLRRRSTHIPAGARASA